MIVSCFSQNLDKGQSIRIFTDKIIEDLKVHKRISYSIVLETWYSVISYCLSKYNYFETVSFIS